MPISPQVQNLASSWGKVITGIQTSANAAATRTVKPQSSPPPKSK